MQYRSSLVVILLLLPLLMPPPPTVNLQGQRIVTLSLTPGLPHMEAQVVGKEGSLGTRMHLKLEIGFQIFLVT
jgi:hypothetical protein